MHWAKQSIEEIKELCIPHRNWQTALSEAYSALVAASPGEVVSIVGPSRVGKSRLIAALGHLLVGDASNAQPGTMPTVTLVAKNCSINGTFSTKTFAARALEVVEHPFYGVGSRSDPWDEARLKLVGRTSEGLLERGLQTAFEMRKTRYVFIDEAQQIIYAQGGERVAGQILDAWKCMADDMGVVLVPVGAYPLLNVLNHSPHLVGRTSQVHFPRYGAIEEDLVVFDQIIETYSQLVQLPLGVATMRIWNDLLYRGSLGCIGLLQRWLRGALARVLAEDHAALSKEYILKTSRTRAALERLAAEIVEGERNIRLDVEESDEDPLESVVTPKTQGARKPFRKKPCRYPTESRA